MSHNDLPDLTQMSDEEAFRILKERSDSGIPLRGAAKAKFKKLEKAMLSNKKQSDVGTVKTNVFGKVSTTKITPKAIRFVQSERDAITARKDTLKANCPDEIIERLGSMRFANDTMLIRAAVRALANLSDAELIEYMKEAQRDMM